MQNQGFPKITEQLDAVASGFCLAKFLEVSMHLESGHNHSCVHPRTHRVTIEEITRDRHALHNSEFKKRVRQQMMSGARPSECGYCWNMERAGALADRSYFSASHLSRDPQIIHKIQSKGPTANYFPSQVEVSFSTTCNFLCTYCGPEVSSRWMKDLDRHGPIELSRVLYTAQSIIDNQKVPIADEEHNPYIEAFWLWLPEAYDQMQSLRLTGGEPLMSMHAFKMLDWITEHANPNLDFGINSNLGVPEKIMHRFITKLSEVASKQTVRKITIWTSGESSGAQAEYTRFGLDYTKWLENIRNILDSCPSVDVRVMTTYSALSMGHYLQFLSDIYEIKARYPGRVILDTHTYLQFPKLMAIDILSEDFLPELQQEVDFVINHSDSTDHERFQALRCRDYFVNRLANPWSDLDLYRGDFFRYFQQFDQRNGTDFSVTFPKLADFYQSCGSLIVSKSGNDA